MAKQIRFKKSQFAHIISKIWDYILGLADDKEYVIEIKEYKEKRSLRANAYMWELLGEISQEIGIPADEIYRQKIKESGLFRVIEISKNAVDTMIHSWGLNGTGWFCEVIDNLNDYATLKLYYGSSSYNTKQMSRLIDAVVQDAQSLNIETKTPDEIARLVSLCDQ